MSMGERDEWATALQTYSARLREKPSDFHTLTNRSFVLLRLGRAEEALEDAERCVEVAPGFGKGYTRVAQALDRLGRRRDALTACIRALELDPEDSTAGKLIMKLDDTLNAGLNVLDRLTADAKERREAVRNMLRGNRFVDKWSLLGAAPRRQLLTRMIAKAFGEVKAAFVDAFRPLESSLASDGQAKTRFTLDALQQELLAVNVVLVSDLLDESAVDDDDDPQPFMLDYIRATADERENGIECCGAGMFALMEFYTFPAFRYHPGAAALSRRLIQAERSTLCLVIAHMLLGGDGLPTLSLQEEAFSSLESKQQDDSDDDKQQDDDDDETAEVSRRDDDSKAPDGRGGGSPGRRGGSPGRGDSPGRGGDSPPRWRSEAKGGDSDDGSTGPTSSTGW
ncbi:hypothetical protein M885DRAFT_508618 [Pelagophyceae sp. CCMP2097]|nr:hypothetical protein M885DRAFT_508618 [Pelagophyceae sp. CCMP2097]